MTVGDEHAWVVGELTDVQARLRRRGCHVRIQQPITLPPGDEPEPDVAVVVGANRDYRGRHPGAADVTCVIEGADSSLRRDRTTKLRIYARAGILTYFIVNLPDRLVEVYRNPRRRGERYDAPEILRAGDALLIPVARGTPLRVPVRQILP